MPEPNNGTLKEWSDYLDELLLEASAASGSGDSGQMSTVQEKLRRFERRSPLVADVLDEIALATVIALHVTNAEQRTESLQAQTEIYRRIRRTIDGAAEGGKT
jgi:hypothetical protein